MRGSIVVLTLMASFLLLGTMVGTTHAILAPTALIVQNNAPWGCEGGGSTADQTALTADGIGFTVVSSSTFLAMNPAQLLHYHEIIFAGDQLQSFYNALSTPVVRTELEVVLAAGVNLVIHGVDEGFCGGFWPSQYVFPYPASPYIAHIHDYDGTNHIVGSGAVLTGVTSPITGNYASHGYFTNVPSGAKVLIENSINQPTYFTWALGKGTLYASTMTLEFYAAGGPGGPVAKFTTLLDNELRLADGLPLV